MEQREKEKAYVDIRSWTKVHDATRDCSYFGNSGVGRGIWRESEDTPVLSSRWPQPRRKILCESKSAPDLILG